jgi:hypothetical protein
MSSSEVKESKLLDSLSESVNSFSKLSELIENGVTDEQKTKISNNPKVKEWMEKRLEEIKKEREMEKKRSIERKKLAKFREVTSDEFEFLILLRNNIKKSKELNDINKKMLNENASEILKLLGLGLSYITGTNSLYQFREMIPDYIKQVLSSEIDLDLEKFNLIISLLKKRESILKKDDKSFYSFNSDLSNLRVVVESMMKKDENLEK